MNHSFLSSCHEYIISTGISFDWFDLGASGSQDIYFMPFYLNSGAYLSVDGRNTSLPQSLLYLNKIGFKTTTNLFSLNSFISDKEGWVYLYETNEGTGSTLFPSRDIDTSALKTSETVSFKRHPVKSISLSNFLLNNNISPFFGKLDLEGSEHLVLSDLFSHNLAPLILEIEINVGNLSEDIQGMDTHLLLSNHGYRLIDLRRTYDFPEISEKSSLSHLLSKAPPTSVAFQGILHQFDGLYIHTSLFDSQDVELLLNAIYCLCMYRQFHLATRFVEHGISDLSLRGLCLTFLERSFSQFTATMNSNPLAYHGFHGWFNWVKSH